MNRPLDHAECSERLRAFVAGELPAAEADAVRGHLASCDRCRAEQYALGELMVAGAPLDEDESQGLRSRILGAVRSSSSDDVIPLRATRPRSWKGARVLAAAALLLGGAVFAGSNLLGGWGGEDEAAVVGGTGGAARVADVQTGLSFSRPMNSRSDLSRSAKTAPLEAEANQIQARENPDDAAAGVADAGSGGGADRDRGSEEFGTTESGYGGPPRPLFVRRPGPLDDRRLRLVGRYGLPMVLFPQAYTISDALRLQEDFLIALANATENEAENQQVIDCGAQVLSQDTPVLPALATFGNYNGERIFVLALAWTEAERGPLDRFMVWTWPAGRCDQVPAYRAGRIGV